MSQSLNPIKPVAVHDPRIQVNSERYYAVMKGGSLMRYQAWPTSSVSSSYIQWTANPPDPHVIMDRRVKVVLPVRLYLTGTVQPGYRLLIPNRCAPRQFPMHAATNTFIATLNGRSVTFNSADIIHPLLAYNIDNETYSRDYSTTPSCPDRTQSYSDLVGEVGNPLSMSGDGTFGSVTGRGGFGAWTVVTNPENTTSTAQTLTAVVDMYIEEMLFMSPFYSGNFDNMPSGFYNLSTFSLTINFLNNGANRMFSVANDPAISSVDDNASVMYFSNFPQDGNPPFTYGGAQVLLLTNFITPHERLQQEMKLIGPITYPYYYYQVNPTDGILPLNYLSVGTAASNNIQLQSIPRRIFIYIRPTNTSFYSNPGYTDSYFRLGKITISFNNKLVMSDATIPELYNICRKNHCTLSYTDFVAFAQYKVGGNTFDNSNRYHGRGGIYCFEPSTDFGLQEGEAAGVGGTWNFQILQLEYENVNASLNNTIPLSLYCVFEYEGSFVIGNSNFASESITCLSEDDVRYAQPMEGVNYKELQEASGGSFLQSIRDLNNTLRDKKYISRAASAINKIATAPILRNLPYAGTIGDVSGVTRDVAQHFGYGGEVIGGEVIGGGSVSKSALARRLKKH